MSQQQQPGATSPALPLANPSESRVDAAERLMKEGTKVNLKSLSSSEKIELGLRTAPTPLRKQP